MTVNFSVDKQEYRKESNGKWKFTVGKLVWPSWCGRVCVAEFVWQSLCKHKVEWLVSNAVKNSKSGKGERSRWRQSLGKQTGSNNAVKNKANIVIDWWTIDWFIDWWPLANQLLRKNFKKLDVSTNRKNKRTNERHNMWAYNGKEK